MPVSDHRGIVYTSNGKAHVVLSAEVSVQPGRGERLHTLCGAATPTKTLELNGLRLAEQYRKGELCETCLKHLKEREATIPGFIVDGEVKVRA